MLSKMAWTLSPVRIASILLPSAASPYWNSEISRICKGGAKRCLEQSLQRTTDNSDQGKLT
jgi:hypothetical protein